VTNAAASAALGRNLSACRGTGACTATARAGLVAPNGLYREERVNLVSMAVSRDFRAAGAAFRPRFELHNILNSNAVNTINTQFGPQWQAVRGVLTPRLAKLAIQVDF
jgi:hypothetical protein